MATQFLDRIPDLIKYTVPKSEEQQQEGDQPEEEQPSEPKMPSLNSLHVFRNQEIDRFNQLITKMKSSLVELKKAING